MESGQRVRIRQRSPFPKPWKWEIVVGDRLVTSSHESFATQNEAYIFGRDALARMAALEGWYPRADRNAISHEIHQGCMVPKEAK
jgi:hypothetical protein